LFKFEENLKIFSVLRVMHGARILLSSSNKRIYPSAARGKGNEEERSKRRMRQPRRFMVG
jgi:hypothetical protein